MIDYKDIGDRIRTVRKRKQMSQKQLADAVGVGVTHISHIETGNTIPMQNPTVNICEVFSLSVKP